MANIRKVADKGMNYGHQIDNFHNVSNPNLVLFSELKGDETPLHPIPGEYLYTDLSWDLDYQPKCAMCTSPHRKVAEIVYLKEDQRPYRVQKFFEYYYGARISGDCVKNHMEKHCGFEKLAQSGIGKIVVRAEEFQQWFFREDELAIDGLLVEIDELKALNIKGSNHAAYISRAKTLVEMYKLLMQWNKERDAKIGKVNTVQVLTDLYNLLKYPEDKEILLRYIKETMEQINAKKFEK